METRLLLSVALVTTAVGTASFGVFSALSDTATSTGNIFDAGVVDLKLNNADSIGAFFPSTLIQQGEVVSGNVTIRNAGTFLGPVLDLDINISVREENGQGYATPVNLAPYIRIVALTYGATNLTSSIVDANGNGFKDLRDWDLNNNVTRDLADPGSAGRVLELRVTLDESFGTSSNGASSRAIMDATFLLALTSAADLGP